MSAKSSPHFVRTVKNILKSILKDGIKMVVNCILLFLLVSGTSVSGWLTWYGSTRHDPSTTPGNTDSNEINRQTESTTSIAGMLAVACPLVVVTEVFSASARLLYNDD